MTLFMETNVPDIYAAAEACPVFSGAKRRVHWPFPDPSQARGSEQEQLAVYRGVCDAIRTRIETELLETERPH